ncbi:MAG: putative toxin-antitoxin system toxin component, PIN family [Deltaproteobacteria bacterium]|nr:putative toxin-antitoxin system toxin component, PIN family [Deltaproteobacteria bacterium]
MRPSAGHAAPPPKVVLDTNVIVSALLFEGVSAQLATLWQTGRMRLVLSRSILEEYLRVLAYPKFGLTDREVKAIVEEEILPFVETIPRESLSNIPLLQDPHDRKFLACLRTGKADYLVTGDKVLLAQKSFAGGEIVTPAEFLSKIDTSN